MSRRLTSDERAARYAEKLEQLCAKPQWKRYPKVAVTDIGALRPDPESTPSRRWHRGEDGPLDSWDATP